MVRLRNRSVFVRSIKLHCRSLSKFVDGTISTMFSYDASRKGTSFPRKSLPLTSDVFQEVVVALWLDAQVHSDRSFVSALHVARLVALSLPYPPTV